MTTPVDLSQVQATVLRGFRHIEMLPHGCYFFVRLGDTTSGKLFLNRLLACVTSCAQWDAGIPPFVLNLGFTAAGLQLLGQPTETFPIEFQLGMARRAPILGDVGESSPEKWQPGFTSPELHAVVSLMAATEEGMATGREFVIAALTAVPGVTLLFTEVADQFPDRAASEHFGFIDGIGQPFVDGSGLTPYPGEGTPDANNTWAPIKTGDFVLGFTNEAGHSSYPDPPFKNGSYMVFRKLYQRVAAFRQYTAEMARHDGGTREHAAARFVGRWQSGAPLELAAEVDDPALAKDCERNNDFRYDSDPGGYKCPFGSHARRANPRADPTGPTLQQVRQHRVIRRSLPYGSWLPEHSEDDGADRGIQFVIINADIAEQFEYVQLNWMNGTLSSTALSTEIDKDAIVGANDDRGKFVCPGVPQPSIAWGLPRFVEVRGGAYFFVPSIATLATLSST